MANLREVRCFAAKHGILHVLDASLIGENAYFIQPKKSRWRERISASC